jgi:hypothetical protein
MPSGYSVLKGNAIAKAARKQLCDMLTVKYAHLIPSEFRALTTELKADRIENSCTRYSTGYGVKQAVTILQTRLYPPVHNEP